MRLVVLLATAVLFVPGAIRAQEAPLLTLELNKLEPISASGAAVSGSAGTGCRAYLVANDPDGGTKYDALRLDLVLFGTDGVITDRVALDIGPVQPGRLQVRPFELKDMPCDSIGQILVNDVMICKVGGADQTGCLDRIKTASRVTTKLVR